MEGDTGSEIGGYRVESEIGRGGMGIVYLARQVFPERRVALKVLSPDLASDPAFRERFIRESNAAASTEHPNIVPVYGAGEAGGQLYLAMRYVEGTDLRSLLEREGPLAPERAARICAEVAEALEAAHERGLVHRDVKPGNVLLDGRERAYLSDFGLIRRTRIDTGITRTGQFMGTVDYVAPEQIKGGELDGRADVYSLGCVLYECLVGAPPLARDSEVATMYAHLEEQVPAPSSVRPEVPRALDEVVARATARRPDDRFATAGEMAAALRGAQMPGGVEPPRRRNLVLGGAIAATVALIVAIAAIAATGDDDPPAGPTGSTDGARIPLNSVVRFDLDSGEVVAHNDEISLVAFSSELPDVSVGEGGVWVLAGINVTHLDPADASTIDAINIPFGGSSVEAGLRTVWVGAPPGVVRIDPIDDEELRPSIRLFGTIGTFPEVEVALGASSAWAVTGNGEVTRIEGESGEVTGFVDVGQSATDIAYGFNRVWVIDDLAGTLTGVDPDTLIADDPIPITGNLDDIAAGARAVWLLDSDAGVVTPYDPETEQLDSPIRVGLDPTDVAVGLDTVWVANHGDGTISRVDPVTRQVETIPIGAPVAAIAVDESAESLWIVIAARSLS